MADEVNVIKKLNYTMSATNQDSRLKSILIITIKHARGLSLNHDAEMYVTVQFGSMFLSKSSKTKYNKVSNPVWNQRFEIEFFHSVEGICSLNGELIQNQNLIICLWNQSADDEFLGQIVLDINNLLFNCDNEYMLKTKPDENSKLINGSLVVSFNRLIQNDAQLKRYCILIKKMFTNLYEANDHYWLLNCKPNDLQNDEYFSANANAYNLLVTKVSNKNGICKLVRALCHFNELVCSFFREIAKRQSFVLSKIAQALNQLIDHIDYYHQNISLYSHEVYSFVSDFSRNIQQLPIKLLCLLGNYRYYYSFNINSIIIEKDNISFQLIELKELIQLISKSCAFCFNRIDRNKNDNNYKKLVIYNFQTSEELTNELTSFDYSQTNFERILEICIKDSSKNFVKRELIGNDNFTKKEGTCSDLELEKLNFIIIEKLTAELEIQNNFFGFCFTPFINTEQFDIICTKYLVIEFLSYLTTRVTTNLNLISVLRNDQIRAHLDIFISVKRIFSTKISNVCTRCGEYQLKWNNFSHLFQPFLIKYIQRQSDQFIKYRYRINDKYTDDEIITNIENLLERKNEEKYYSCSVKDIFLKLNEILDVVLNFETKTLTKDSSYQLEYATLVKNEVLNYVVCLKNEFYKCGNVFNERKMEIETCILINNLCKTLELINELKVKLSAESNIDCGDSFESLTCIISEDLTEIIRGFANNCTFAISTSCFDFIQKISKIFLNNENLDTKVMMVLNETILKSLNERLFICQHILFNKMFKQVIGVIFKITLKIIDALILYNKPKRSLKINRSLSSVCMATNELKQQNEMFEASLRLCLDNIVHYFSANENYLSKRCLLKTKEYVNLIKTLDLLPMASGELITQFIEMENVIDSKTIGRMNISIEVHQDLKKANHWLFKVKIPKMELEFDESEIVPVVEISSIGPDVEDKCFLTRVFKSSNTERGFKELAEFRVNFRDDKRLIDKLKLYEFHIIVKNLKDFSKIATSVLNFKDVFSNQINKECANFEFTADLWVPLKFKLKANLESLKILEILEKRRNCKNTRNFVNIKKMCLI